MAHPIGTTYSNSRSSGSSYSAGIWQGTNAVFPSIPGGSSGTTPQIAPHPSNNIYPKVPGGSLPGDRVPQPSAPTGSVPAKKAGFRLRRSILPKQPLTILHDLCAAAGSKPQFEFWDVPFEERERRAWQMDCDLEDVGSYECRCMVSGMEFIGEGATKNEAKDSVIDIAIQGVVAVRCELNYGENGIGNNEDNTPWPALASLALYKLFTDWQSQGYNIPKELTDVTAHIPKHLYEENRPTKSGNVPECMKHPPQLLNELASRMNMRVEYDCISEIGPPNDKVFCFGVKIGSKVYKGQAKNKKEAKRNAAQAAVNDKDNWYSPTVNNPPPPGEVDMDIDNDSPGSSSAGKPPPSKQKKPMSEAMKRLYFGKDNEEQPKKPQDPKIVFREPSDKGSQPGSYPGSRKDLMK